MKCVNNGTCMHENQLFENWSEIPDSTQKCFCENGQVQCRPRGDELEMLPHEHDLNVTVTVMKVLATSVEFLIGGIPENRENLVNLYRVLVRSDSSKDVVKTT